MNQSDIQRIMDQIPGLNDHGIGISDVTEPEDRERELADGTALLLDSAEQCTKICEWLEQNIAKTASINTGHGSYGLKDLAERDIGYITNGAFIAAAIHCDYPYRLMDGSANVMFGMSERSIKDAMRRQKREGKANWAIAG